MAQLQHHLQDRIAIDPAVMVGKPVVKGTRIPVARVLGRLAHNPDLADLFSAYPELTVEDVKACLDYARMAGSSPVLVMAPRVSAAIPTRPGVDASRSLT
jgi:uncharacterized protein (DUF433 family)